MQETRVSIHVCQHGFSEYSKNLLRMIPHVENWKRSSEFEAFVDTVWLSGAENQPASNYRSNFDTLASKRAQLEVCAYLQATSLPYDDDRRALRVVVQSITSFGYMTVLGAVSNHHHRRGTWCNTLLIGDTVEAEAGDNGSNWRFFQSCLCVPWNPRSHQKREKLVRALSH